jgi:hypothetical protein
VIVFHVPQVNPQVEFANTIYQRCAGLQLFPNRGRRGKTLAVEIVRIYHSAQNWP